MKKLVKMHSYPDIEKIIKTSLSATSGAKLIKAIESLPFIMQYEGHNHIVSHKDIKNLMTRRIKLALTRKQVSNATGLSINSIFSIELPGRKRKQSPSKTIYIHNHTISAENIDKLNRYYSTVEKTRSNLSIDRIDSLKEARKLCGLSVQAAATMVNSTRNKLYNLENNLPVKNKNSFKQEMINLYKSLLEELN